MATELIGYLLAVLVGVSLGLIGSGGSILTVPILVYVMGVNPVLATAYSLFVVGTTSLVGGVQSVLQKRADLKTVLIFGVPSILSVYLTRAYIVPQLPDVLFHLNGFVLTKSMTLMILFAAVMILASVSMIKPRKTPTAVKNQKPTYNYPLILVEGALVGILTGLVG